MASYNDVTTDPVPTSGQGDANQTTGNATAPPPTDPSTVVNVTGSNPPPALTGGSVAPSNSSTTTPSTSSSGIDWSKIATSAIPLITNYMTNSQQTTDQTKQAALIGQLSDKYGAIANPYGAYRDAAAQKLAALQADPSSIVNTPGYKFSLSQGLGAVGNQDARKFGMGAGSTNPDLMTFAQGLASKTYNDTIAQYSAQAGVPQGTAPAASIYQQGIQGIAGATAAANAAKGANTNLIGGAAAGLLKQLTDAGVPAAIASQIVKSAGGSGSSTGGGSTGANGANLPSSDPNSAGAGNPGTPATDVQGTTPAVVGPGTGWMYDQNGNIVQDPNYVDPNLLTPDPNFIDPNLIGGP